MTRIRTIEIILLATGFILMSVDSNAMLVFHPQADAGHQQHNRRAPKLFKLTGHEHSRVTLITPDLGTRTVSPDNGLVSFKPTGMDNYHALVAQGERNGVKESAVRYIYTFGKPSGFSPSELTHYSKTDLEIIPDPLPREHWHYKAGDEVTFSVRFKGLPLASTPVSLFTSHASTVEATTDTQGRVLFKLPDDFPQTLEGENANTPAEMMLHVKHIKNDQPYASWLSAEYRANPEHWKSTQLGVLVATGGFLFGTFISGLGLSNPKTQHRA